MTDDRTARFTSAVRDGWHGLAGGDAASCPGCPVCALGDQVDRLDATDLRERLDPATGEHLQAAVGHLAAAGRELLAALAGRTTPTDAPASDSAASSGTVDPTATPRPADPEDAPPSAWTRIPVSTRENEEHP